MASQRFCLRWNNHQTNMLSVFDQLLHAETFTDVTLAVDGQYLKAHKMVLSACSPYFQKLFVNHSEKDPIVIIKDVPYADMKSLLDFMYRGEVSVDQERLAAFLKVAESLRIKGLTEVSDDGKANTNSTPPPPPPQLHRINASTLPMQKRKRGRPRKLSGSSNGNDFDDDPQIGTPEEMLEVKMGTDGFSGNEGSDENTNRENDDDSNTETESKGPSAKSRRINNNSVNKDQQQNDRTTNKDQENTDGDSNCIELSGDESTVPVVVLPQLTAGSSVLKQQLTNNSTPNNTHTTQTYLQQQLASGPRNPTNNAHESSAVGSPSIAAQTRVRMSLLRRAAIQDQKQSNNHESFQSNKVPSDSKSQGKATNVPSTYNNVTTSPSDTPGRVHSPPLNHDLSSPPPHQSSSLLNTSGGSSLFNSPHTTSPSMKHVESGGSMPGTPTHTSRPQIRRRIRRKACSSMDDPAEQLTEMSVRGLNLFRYAVISQGVYQCTECAKENVQKTFKNKYSFQRHAFLYHEGAQRKVFPCPMCGKEFSRPDKMKNHLKTTHECYMGKDMQFNPLNFLIGSGGPDLISNNNNDSQKLDDDSDAEVGEKLSPEHDMMTALGLSFTAATTATQSHGDKSEKGVSGRLPSGPTADVMAALGLSYSGHSPPSIKTEVTVEGAE